MAEPPARPEPADQRQLRASDADRERVAEILHRAASEGRLGLDELEERLSVVYAARTYAELEPVTHDLPVASGVPAPAPASAPAPARRGGARRSSGGAVAIMGGFQRKGHWFAPGVFRCLAFWGGGEIDLREAVLGDGEITIQAFALMGGVSIIVPENAQVAVGGTGIMGGFSHRATGPGQQGGPHIRVTGLAVWGGVDVERKPSEDEIKRRKLERKQQKQGRRQIED
jgi:hypothetical protein